MTRIKPLSGPEAPLLLKLLNLLSRRMMGKEMEPVGILAHNPRFLLPYAMTTFLISGKSQVDPRIRSLSTELAAHLNGCSWCVDFGRAAALKDGVSADKLDHLEEYATSQLFDPRERAALDLAHAITHDIHVPDDVWDTARRHFSDRELVELVVAVAIETFYNRVNGAFDIDSQGFCELPRLARTQEAAA